MIGEISTTTNDVFIYFENNEITLVSKQLIKGNFLSPRNDKFVPLEVSVNETNSVFESVKTDCKRDAENNYLWYSLTISRREYDRILRNEKFIEKGCWLKHEGFRQIHLCDATKLTGQNLRNYENLCSYRDEFTNKKIE